VLYQPVTSNPEKALAGNSWGFHRTIKKKGESMSKIQKMCGESQKNILALSDELNKAYDIIRRFVRSENLCKSPSEVLMAEAQDFLDRLM